MIPRKQLDLSWSDLFMGLWKSLRHPSRDCLWKEVVAAWDRYEIADHSSGRSIGDEAGAIMVSLSVRSGFDAALQELAWPAGSEVLVSGITIRDMPRILEGHGLRVVPVPVDIETLSVRADDVSAAITSRTRGLLVAHLFGARMAMSPIIEVARKHNLFVFEDCAQAFTGDSSVGHPESDVRMFSFGPIKTATALGGAILSFRDAELGRRVAVHQSTWPVQSSGDFRRRVCRFGLLKLLSARLLFTLFVAGCRWWGVSHDGLLSRSVRGFGGGDFFSRIRRQPSSPLLALLARRLRQDHRERIERRQALAQQLDQVLDRPDRPGREAADHSFWVYPIYHDQADDLMRHLWSNGFDATRGASSMGLIGRSDTGTSEPGTVTGDGSHAPAPDSGLHRLLYLPFDPSLTENEVARLSQAIRSFQACQEGREQVVG